MLPNNISSFTNEEMVKFIWDNPDPLIQELCNRLEGMDYKSQIEELEEKISDLEDKLELAPDEDDYEYRGQRIEELEALLREHKIEIPE